MASGDMMDILRLIKIGSGIIQKLMGIYTGIQIAR
jgi:hypothetical protein